MNEKKYIEREKAFDAVFGQFCASSDETEAALNAVIEEIRAIPAADVRPVKRGTWTLNKDGSGICSECGRTQNGCWDLDNWDNFCHFCGADMRRP